MIEFKEVTKSFGDRRAVDSVSFSCPPGSVTGFLGPNGAGKSTTMRALCGLIKPDSGAASVLGRRFADLPNPAREVGVLLDAGAQHNGRTGAETLRLTALTIGVDPARAEALLDEVGLGHAGSKRVGDYSLGMRQRLGIANALIGDPRILVLDEPANGLDPAGIRWMRKLLRDFADAGGTVLLSSHLLKEVDAVADDLVIIADGRIVRSGPREQLLAGGGTTAAAEDSDALAAAVSAAGLACRATADGRLLIDAPPIAVSRAALAARVPLTYLDNQGGDALEHLFFELVGGDAVAA